MLKRIMQLTAAALLTLAAGTDATAQTLKFDTDRKSVGRERVC